MHTTLFFNKLKIIIACVLFFACIVSLVNMKGKIMYCLIWKNEIIESNIETMKEAIYLKGEYELAYGGTVKIVKEK